MNDTYKEFSMHGISPPDGYYYAIGTVRRFPKSFHPVAYFQQKKGLKSYCRERNDRHPFRSKFVAAVFFEGEWILL